MTVKANLSAHYAASVTLTTASYANPLTVSGTIAPGSGDGLYGAGPPAWTVLNSGTIESAATAGAGVRLGQGSNLQNLLHGTIQGYDGVVISGGGLLQNAGSIGGTGTGNAFGVSLVAGGSLVNQAGGQIGGSYGGVAVLGAPGSIDNFATIAAATGIGVTMNSGGTVINEFAGLLSSFNDGVVIGGGERSVVNFGTITAASGIGVNLTAGGGAAYVLNSGSITGLLGVEITQAATVLNSGLIDGQTYNGLLLAGGGTLTNSGTIAGPVVAAQFGAGFANRLIDMPGAVFLGTVDGGNAVGATAVSTLELAGSSGSPRGVLRGVGYVFTNFGAIAFDAGARWLLSGSVAGLAGGEVISGFTAGDTIQLTGVDASYSGFAGGTLALSGGIDLLLAGSFSNRFAVRLSPGSTDITLACFAAGTRILTDAGEVAVEALRPGVRVVSLAHGRALPARWVGWQRSPVAPVRIAAGAFGAEVPHRDLFLSPDHAVFVDGALVPVRHLVNGASIAPVACGEVVYVHIELAAHGVLLADGLPAESFLDTGNRAAFAQAAHVAATAAKFDLDQVEAEFAA